MRSWRHSSGTLSGACTPALCATAAAMPYLQYQAARDGAERCCTARSGREPTRSATAFAAQAPRVLNDAHSALISLLRAPPSAKRMLHVVFAMHLCGASSQKISRLPSCLGRVPHSARQQMRGTEQRRVECSCFNVLYIACSAKSTIPVGCRPERSGTLLWRPSLCRVDRRSLIKRRLDCV